jgi:RNA polymerase sigma-70 factor (ECF subfamily)
MGVDEDDMTPTTNPGFDARALLAGGTRPAPDAPQGARDDLSRSLRFADVFRDHHAFVHRVVQRLLGPGDADVDDVVQEVFLVVLRKLGSWDGACRLTTWLYGVTWRVASSHRRRRRVRAFFSFEQGGSDFPEPADERPSPEQRSIQQQSSHEVYRVLDRLGEKKREVLILYELEGLSGTEISELLGVAEGTVWTRLHHARHDFRRAFDKMRAARGADEFRGLLR